MAHLEALTRIAKQYLVTVQLSRQEPAKVPMKAEKEGGLPGAPKRDALEQLVWQAIQEAVAYSKTEDGAKDAEARLWALRVANSLMRTELAILKDQDDAFVDELIKLNFSGMIRSASMFAGPSRVASEARLRPA